MAAEHGFRPDGLGYMAKEGERVACLFCTAPIAADQIGGLFEGEVATAGPEVPLKHGMQVRVRAKGSASAACYNGRPATVRAVGRTPNRGGKKLWSRAQVDGVAWPETFWNEELEPVVASVASELSFFCMAEACNERALDVVRNQGVKASEGTWSEGHGRGAGRNRR